MLAWPTRVDPSGTFAYRVAVIPVAAPASVVWDSGFVFLTNQPFPHGAAVYQGAPLAPGATYTWTATELQGGKSWTAGEGTFTMAADLRTPAQEALSELASANVTSLYRGTLGSIVDRILPNGYADTSVSGGYSGMFIRDTAAMGIALLEVARQEGHDDAAATIQLCGRMLRYALQAMASPPGGGAAVGRAPHVIIADGTTHEPTQLDMADQTDGSMHLLQLFARYMQVSGDVSLLDKYFPLCRAVANSYFADGAATAAGVAYLNATVEGGGSLLFNPNLEHSRDGVYWTTFDVLTNAFAVEALRGMIQVAGTYAERRRATADMRGHAVSDGLEDDVARWTAARHSLVDGLNKSLKVGAPGPTSTGTTTSDSEFTIYGELRGHHHTWWPGPNNSYPPGNTTEDCPLLWGTSWVQTGVIAAMSAVVEGRADAATAAWDVPRMQRTRDVYDRWGSFLWITDDALPSDAACSRIAASLSPPLKMSDVRVGPSSMLVPTTHTWSADHTGGANVVIGKGLGWDIAFAVHTKDWVRVAALYRWLGAAAVDVSLYGESYVYDCIREHKYKYPGEPQTCWGDTGNGEQIGWFVWATALATRTLATEA